MKRVPDFPISVHVEDNPLRKKDARFLANVRFRNELPEIPSDPKMLLSQLDLDEMGKFRLFRCTEGGVGSGGRESTRFPVDMGLSTSSLYIEQYDVYEGDVLEREDAGLLGGEGAGAGAEKEQKEQKEGVVGQQGRKRVKGVDNAPWLMRTKYISSESGGGGLGRGPGGPGRAGGVGVGVEDLEGQVGRIRRSFTDAREVRPVHPLDSGLKVVDVKPVLPDEALEDWKLVLVNFDADPVEGMKLEDPGVAKKRKWGQSLHLKTLKSAEYGRFAVILAPRKGNGRAVEWEYKEDEMIPGKAFLGDYEWVRTYNETVRVDENAQTYLFRMGDDAVTYSDLSNKLSLRKRKKSKKAGGQGELDGVDSLKPEKMVLIAEDDD